MKNKPKFFDLGLYAQGLKRIRVIGLALAILCITISAIVPITHWIETDQSFYRDVEAWGENADLIRQAWVTELDMLTICIPAVVASFVTPLFVFLIFSYLNKRKESDFYHAVPYTRTCVYVSFMAAAMTWAWGILVLSSLTSAALWALDPYATLALSMLGELLAVICLNALLLCAVAAAAVSLMGTLPTSLIAFGILLAGWRYVLGMAYMVIDDLSDLVRAEDVLGGYLHPSFVLPVGIVTEGVSFEYTASLWYALAVSILFLVLGCVCYVKRSSEVAGRSVPGRWLHRAVRTLLCLPFALLITYWLMCEYGSDVSLILVFLVLTLLVFYLYELLTTRSFRSMMRATPWLGSVLAICLLFGGAVALGNTVIENEHIEASDVKAVRFDQSYGMAHYGLNEYEMYKLTNGSIQDGQAVKIVTDAFAKTQEAVRTDSLYSDNYDFEYLYMQLTLKNGAKLTRRVRFEPEELSDMIALMRKDMDVDPMPDTDEVNSIFLQLDMLSYQVLLDRGCYGELLDTLKREWKGLSDEQRSELLYGSADRFSFAIQMALAENEWLYMEIYPNETTPGTLALMYSLLDADIAQGEELHRYLDRCAANATTGYLTVALMTEKESASVNWHHYQDAFISSACQVLSDYQDKLLDASRVDEAHILLLRFTDSKVDTYYKEYWEISSSYDFYGEVAVPDIAHSGEAVLLLLDLNEQELSELKMALENVSELE